MLWRKNYFIDCAKLPDSPFNFTKRSFDFSISLGMLHTSDDVFDPVLIQKLLELMMSLFPVPS